MNNLKINNKSKNMDNLNDILGFTTEFIVSAWIIVNKDRSRYDPYEVLWSNVIDIDNRINDNDCVDEYLRGGIELNTDHGSRLVYIVHHVKCVYSKDYYGEVDMDYEIGLASEKRCNSWRHMRAVMESFE